MSRSPIGCEPVAISHVATKVFFEDLKLRAGFRELIAQIDGDWPKIEEAMRMKVEKRIRSNFWGEFTVEDLD